jgi:sugar phosphate isomerase/epimerase
VKDRSADPDRTDTRFGKGATPIAAFCRAMKDVRFAYAANIEFELEESDPTEGVRDCFAYLKKALTS